MLWACVVDSQPLLVIITLWASCWDEGMKGAVGSQIGWGRLRGRRHLPGDDKDFATHSPPATSTAVPRLYCYHFGFWTKFNHIFISYFQVFLVLFASTSLPSYTNTDTHLNKCHCTTTFNSFTVNPPPGASVSLLIAAPLTQDSSNLLSRAVWTADVPACLLTAKYGLANLLRYPSLLC